MSFWKHCCVFPSMFREVQTPSNEESKFLQLSLVHRDILTTLESLLLGKLTLVY